VAVIGNGHGGCEELGTHPRQLHHLFCPDKSQQMVVVEIDCQALTNQARRHCVKNTANRDGAVTSDFDTEVS